MAKGSNMLGKFRGKMGGMVYRVDPEAGQVVSEYNSSPKNPRTMAQTTQRSKMNMAGLLSKMTPYMAIAGLDAGRRRARSMFVSNIIKNITSVASANGATQTLAAAALVLSKGRNLLTRVDFGAWSQDQTVSVLVYNDESNINFLFARVVVYFSKDGKYISCQVADTATITATQSVSVNIPVPLPIQEEGGEMNVYVIPVVDDNADARALYQNYIADPESSEDYQVAFTRSLVSLGVFGESVFGGNHALTV